MGQFETFSRKTIQNGGGGMGGKAGNEVGLLSPPPSTLSVGVAYSTKKSSFISFFTPLNALF